MEYLAVTVESCLLIPNGMMRRCGHSYCLGVGRREREDGKRRGERGGGE